MRILRAEFLPPSGPMLFQQVSLHLSLQVIPILFQPEKYWQIQQTILLKSGSGKIIAPQKKTVQLRFLSGLMVKIRFMKDLYILMF